MTSRRGKLVLLDSAGLTSAHWYNRGIYLTGKVCESSPQVHKYSREIVLKETIFSTKELRLYENITCVQELSSNSQNSSNYLANFNRIWQKAEMSTTFVKINS